MVVLRFGRVALDLEGREVRLDGDVQHLEPQAFDVLAYLHAHRDRVVPQVELLDEIWGDQFVSAAALTTRIKEVRRAVGDDGRTQAVIKNVRARGYRFVAQMDQEQTGSTDPLRPLPRPPQLIGREQELAELADVLSGIDGSPLVTLVGPGGVGKTALALRAARQLAPLMPDGVVFVDLASIEDPDAVVAGLRQAVGSTMAAADQDLFIAGLATRDGLLVLDNCEHVIDTVADVAARIIAAEGPIRLLATSRERLALADERLLPVGPLPLADARTLFLERATRVHPGLVVEQEDRPLLDRIIESLDRLPLTVEMAAGRTSALGLDDLANLVDQGRKDHQTGSTAEETDILRSTNRGAVNRHRTVGDLVRWSTELLSPARRRLLADLSVFAGAVEIDDIVGVLSRDGTDRAELVDGLTALVDRSLVSVDRQHRRTSYRLLETTKQFVRTLPGSPGIAQRHGHWFAEAADQADRDLRTAREPSGDERFRRIFAELRSAHGWARRHDLDLACRLTGAVTLYAHTRLRSEPAQWAEGLLSALPDDHPDRSAPLAMLAGNAVHRGDTAGAAALTAECLALGVSGRTELSVTAAAADQSLFVAEYDQTHRHCDRLVELAERDGDLYHLAFGLSGRALALVYDGRPAEALDALNVAEVPPGLPGTADAWMRFARGEALTALGRREEALAQYQRGLAAAESVDGQYPLSIIKVGVLTPLTEIGDPETARAQLRQILIELQRDGVTTHAVVTMRNLVDLLLRTEDDEQAMTVLGALSTEEITAIFGPRDAEVAERRAVADDRGDPAQVDRWLAEGRRMSIADATRYSLQILEPTQDSDDR